ncbi:MAG: hypothetical protein Nkreftii_001734 [Candidatus Nitrospira kreftii]|uniref:Uncharacterized protein n=1 Tax=Candidatus Nitrospira kreftii TaxID=2652173 RepID=A0A7S8IZG4_9BACT|nr:MAG: hypothetical protein Nkreftii_001734 [Candidatus Nitrospira kreftii]
MILHCDKYKLKMAEHMYTLVIEGASSSVGGLYATL